eukprot:765518-Hanusia_phi.AAC.13
MQSSFDRVHTNGYGIINFYDKYHSLGVSPLASHQSSYPIAASPSYKPAREGWSPSTAALRKDGTRTPTSQQRQDSSYASNTPVRYVAHAPNEKHIVSITSPGTNQAPITPQVSRVSDQKQSARISEQRQVHDTSNFGVGIDMDPKTMKITALKPGCSAALNGEISIGDELVLVDGVQCKTAQDVFQTVLGRQGTEVQITFRRPSGHEYSVRLLRGGGCPAASSGWVLRIGCVAGSDFIQFWERCRALEVKVATLENENAKLLSENGRMSRNKNFLSFEEHNSNALIRNLFEQLEQMKSQINHLEAQNQELRQRNSRSSRASGEGRNENQLQQMAEVHEKNAVLQMQLASLQKLLHEKDEQIYSLNRKNIELHQSNLKLMHEKETDRYPQKEFASPSTPPLVSSKRQTLVCMRDHSRGN